MPIKGLTDRGSLKPRLARLGKLRKGGEKTGNKPGPDLDHFRFTSDNPDIVKAFQESHGDKPRAVNIVLFYETIEENFSTWIECWDASGLVFRSDGDNWLIWRDGDSYKRGKKQHQDQDGQDIVGRFEFVIPDLVQQGYLGTVTLETHSNHDLRNIASILMAAEQERGSLRGAQFVLRRVEEEISVPGWGDRKGKRSTAKKWLVRLEPPKQIFTMLMNADRPALEETNEQMRELVVVDAETGEIVESAHNDAAFICDDCNEEITDFDAGDGRVFTVSELIELGDNLRNNPRHLCGPCMKAHNERVKQSQQKD